MRENGENRRRSDQERMIGGVFEKTIHSAVGLSRRAGRQARGPIDRGGLKKGAKYSSRPGFRHAAQICGTGCR